MIENTQAIEMAETYSNISSSSMSAFASLISNNLSVTMKLLTAITIVLAIPTMISGFWGMNVDVPLDHLSQWGFWSIVLMSLGVCVATILLLKKKDMF